MAIDAAAFTGAASPAGGAGPVGCRCATTRPDSGRFVRIPHARPNTGRESSRTLAPSVARCLLGCRAVSGAAQVLAVLLAGVGTLDPPSPDGPSGAATRPSVDRDPDELIAGVEPKPVGMTRRTNAVALTLRFRHRLQQGDARQHTRSAAYLVLTLVPQLLWATPEQPRWQLPAAERRRRRGCAGLLSEGAKDPLEAALQGWRWRALDCGVAQ